MATTNYSIPEFSSTDSIDLIGVYNAAMQIIDTKLKSIESQMGTLSTTQLDQVTTNKNDITLLKKNVLVWIGDSFSDPNIVPLNWVPIVASGIHAELHSFAKSGAGFSKGLLFNTQLQNAIDDTTFDNASVKNIVLYGGNNDVYDYMNGSYTNLYKDALTFARNIKNNFPNAKVHIAVCNITGDFTLSAERNYGTNIYNAFSEIGQAFDYVPNVDQWQNMLSNSYLSASNAHPSLSMCYSLIRLFSTILTGGGGSTLNNAKNVPISNVHKGIRCSVAIGDSEGVNPFYMQCTPTEQIPAGDTLFRLGNDGMFFNNLEFTATFMQTTLNFYFDRSGNCKCYQNIPASSSTFNVLFPKMTWRRA